MPSTTYTQQQLRQIISSAAQKYGIPPNALIAEAEQESGTPGSLTGALNPNAVGAGSYGLFQEQQGGELTSYSGNNPALAEDPYHASQIAAQTLAAAKSANPSDTWGQLAAISQRPADPTGYASMVNQAMGGGGMASTTTNQNSLANLLNQAAAGQLAQGQANIGTLQATNPLIQKGVNLQAGAQQQGTALQEASLALSGANIGLQQAGVTAQQQQATTQQGLQQQGYNLALAQAQQGMGQQTSQYNIATALNQLQSGGLTSQYGLQQQQQQLQSGGLAAQYGYQQQSNDLTQQGLNTQYGIQNQQNTLSQQNLDAQFGLQAQQYGTNLGNMQYNLGVAQRQANSAATASGALNTQGYGNTQQNIAQQYGYNVASLQNQFAGQEQAYGYGTASLGLASQSEAAQYQQQTGQLGIAEQSQAQSYQQSQAQLGLQSQSQEQAYNQAISQLGLQQQSASSAYGYGQQQAQENIQQGAIAQKSEVSGYQYSQADLARQQQTLSNIAAANGISQQQAQNQLQSGLAQLGLSSVMDTSGLLQEITQAEQGQAGISSSIAGNLSLSSGLGALFGGK